MKYVCRYCKTTNDWYLNQCPRCGRGGMVPKSVFLATPKVIEAPPPPLTTFRGTAPLSGIRISTGIPGLDRVLGYNRRDPEKRTGMFRPSVILMGGENGCGKSTILMQMCAYCADRSVMYNSTEQPLGEIRANAEGIGLGETFLDVEARAIGDLPALLEEIHKVDPHILVLDSISDLSNSESRQKDPLVMQVEMAKAFMRESEEYKRTIFLIAHLNAGQEISGRADLKHAVGATLMFSKGPGKRRILKAMKNRFGATNEVAMFDMEECGLVDVEFGEDAQSAAQNQQSAPDSPPTKRGMF
ncbi:MAG: AAA family ATPase [Acidobacteriota bacterium]